MIGAAALRALARQAAGPKLALLLVLMVLAALTEGFGLLLLVPMLSVLDSGSGLAGTLAARLAEFGVPMRLGPLLAIFVALVIARSVIGHLRTMQAFQVEVQVVDSLRSRAWQALLHCDWRVLSDMRQSDNASLLITNIERVGMGLNQILSALATLVMLGGIALAALVISPMTALAAMLGGGVVLLAYGRLHRRAAAAGKQLGDAFGDMYGQIAETLGALRVVKSFGREDVAIERGLEVVRRMRTVQHLYLRDSGYGQIALQTGGALLLAVVVWTAITRWQAGPAEILPLVALFARALPMFGSLQHAWQNWAHASPAIDDTMRLIALAEAAREPDLAQGEPAPELTAAIALEGVTVSYPTRPRPALDHVDLALRVGSITAIVGPSGSGKSTLADLLGGLIAPDAGAVTIDGQPLGEGRRRAWRARVTYVQQEPVLFSGTVRENLLWAVPDAADPQLLEALRMAAADFVEALPAGLDTRVGEGGRQLSGGERQRIVLARALLRRPALLILDEAASALDGANEAAIAAAVARLRGSMTIVIIGHRGALAALADRTVTLDAGRIVELNG